MDRRGVCGDWRNDNWSRLRWEVCWWEISLSDNEASRGSGERYVVMRIFVKRALQTPHYEFTYYSKGLSASLRIKTWNVACDILRYIQFLEYENGSSCRTNLMTRCQTGLSSASSLVSPLLHEQWILLTERWWRSDGNTLRGKWTNNCEEDLTVTRKIRVWILETSSRFCCFLSLEPANE